MEWKLVEILEGGIRNSLIFSEEDSDDESENEIDMNVSVLQQRFKKKRTYLKKWQQEIKTDDCTNQL